MRDRDALGRRRRLERRRIEELRRLLGPLTASGHHPTVAAIAGMARRVRAEAGLSLHAVAELAGMTPEGVWKFEHSKAGGHNGTLGRLCRVYRLDLSAFFQRIEMDAPLRRLPPG